MGTTYQAEMQEYRYQQYLAKKEDLIRHMHAGTHAAAKELQYIIPTPVVAVSLGSKILPRLTKLFFKGNKTAGAIRNINKLKGTMNCTNCVTSTDLALDGIKSSALPKALSPAGKYVDDAVPISFLEDIFGSKFVKTSISKLNKLKHGKKGIIYGVSKETGGGHVFNVVNQKGVIRFLDGQTGNAANINNWKNLHFYQQIK